ncbi:keratin-associated protein 10-5-like [Physella acuta]|uniref:keratin-associated protein 10-5-like n=1 Tax=Physella acuta TaxID=109671 RepID=UPI0027DD67BB|nr:keratin-associated protein 10-5-like [Physella acuta]
MIYIFRNENTKRMKTIIILVTLVTMGLAEKLGIDVTWTCPSLPQTCIIQPSQTVKVQDECRRDEDCQLSARCCYMGCIRRCVLPDPCEKVVCKEGYACISRETACADKPCQREASCVPENDVRCAPLTCVTEFCPAGFERVMDKGGCLTCQCQAKKDCGPSCNLFCSHGQAVDTEGCPVCRCNPEPENPCTNMTCPQGQQCRFIKEPTCEKAPYKPAVMCVTRPTVLYDNSCSLRDRTTVGLPVLADDHKTEVDCYSQHCPDGTVCTTLGRNISRCCWQQTQQSVLTPPKAGECPQEYMTDYSNMNRSCEIDAQCPDDQKCCLRLMQPGMVRFYGYCLPPVHKVLESSSKACTGSSALSTVLHLLGYC